MDGCKLLFSYLKAKNSSERKTVIDSMKATVCYVVTFRLINDEIIDIKLSDDSFKQLNSWVLDVDSSRCILEKTVDFYDSSFSDTYILLDKSNIVQYSIVKVSNILDKFIDLLSFISLPVPQFLEFSQYTRCLGAFVVILFLFDFCRSSITGENILSLTDMVLAEFSWLTIIFSGIYIFALVCYLFVEYVDKGYTIDRCLLFFMHRRKCSNKFSKLCVFNLICTLVIMLFFSNLLRHSYW